MVVGSILQIKVSFQLRNMICYQSYGDWRMMPSMLHPTQSIPIAPSSLLVLHYGLQPLSIRRLAT